MGISVRFWEPRKSADIRGEILFKYLLTLLARFERFGPHTD
jgi:hypothetical protein